ncbi:type II secretion system inner membrane protein GspF [Pelobacter seleniigenes]|uniref:type II secretion system inner membrane protein GspF n=1 Tax=Pelobacter seleniigenes TaxID=407188 RepID=UPI0004A755CF|nr:type II secretion system inner membrane protein GspF [Pelobacter seleniigenes]
MPLFEYSGLDAQGRKVSGKIDGTGRKAVMQKLSQQGVFLTDLKEMAAASSSGGIRRLSLRRKISPVELAAATRQLGTLLGAGIPLDEVLATVADQTDQSALSSTFMSIREKVLQGSPFFEAIGEHSGVFPDLFINMIQVGENSGTLDQVLNRLADFLDEQARIRSRIQAAMAYPILMTVVGTGVLIFLFIFVVPKITGMLTEMGQALPWPTQMLITLSSTLANWWWLLLIGVALALAGLRRYRNTAAGRLKMDRLSLKIPLYGRLNLFIATARFSRTLGTLLQSGVPLLKALDITRTLLNNRVLREAVETARKEVQEGGSLARSLKNSAAFPPMLAQISAAGEKSGQLEPMLFRLADTYEHQTDLSITGLLSLLEPIMILVMGTVVGFVVLAILLPIFEASQGF